MAGVDDPGHVVGYGVDEGSGNEAKSGLCAVSWPCEDKIVTYYVEISYKTVLSS